MNSRTVIGIDFIQTMLSLVGVVLLGRLAIDKVCFDNIHSAVWKERPDLLLNLLRPAAIMFLFDNLLFGVGGIFHSNVWCNRCQLVVAR
jgi:hypothetical protein